MAQIGTFKRTKTGFSGHILTLALDAKLILVPVDKSDVENAPDYRIHLGDDDGLEVGPEVGAGWKRNGEKAGDYVSLHLDDPSLDNRSAPICSRPMIRERHSICCGIVRHAAIRRRDAMSVRPANPIPLFDRKLVNPFVPIGIWRPSRAASVKSLPGVGWPQAGARALPLTEASTVARSRPAGSGARG